MAGGNHLPAFDEIIKRGSATEPRSNRPTPRIFDPDKIGDLSLNSEVEAAKHKKVNNKSKKSKNLITNEESGFSSDSSRDIARKRTPMTMPRTKITAATPLEQKIGLNLLKQKLDFADKKDKKKNQSNNQQQNTKPINNAPHKENLPIDLLSLSSAAPSEMSDINIGKMNERLEQVREFLKQATSMYVSLSMATSEDPKRMEQMGKLAKLIQQLRVQEQGYLELFQKTMTFDNNIEAVTDEESTATEDQSESDVADESKLNQVNNQQQEIERLREQQALLKKIVEQQKELDHLKDRQATLLHMQQNAERLLPQKKVNAPQNNQRKKVSNEEKIANNAKSAKQNGSLQIDESTALMQADAAQKRLLLESKLMSLQAKKDQMDKAMSTLKALKNGNVLEGENNTVLLNRDDLDELTSEFASSTQSLPEVTVDNNKKIENMSIQEKIVQLNDVRDRLQELRGIVAEYEAMNGLAELQARDDSRDNRLHAQAMLKKEKEANTLTGLGGARLRIPNTQQPNNLEFHDNRKRPPPQKHDIDVQRNPPSPKHKNTNQEVRSASNLMDFEALLKDFPPEYQAKIREIQALQEQQNKIKSMVAINNEESYQNSECHSESVADETETEKDTDTESDISSSLQWQDDPDFNKKVKKLQIAKDKLHHLQQLVKVVQQGGGPHLPVEDLENLTLTFSEDQNEFSEYGESEEEAEEENVEETCDDDDDEDDDGNISDEELSVDIDDDDDDDELAEENKSEISKSTDQYFSGGLENGMSDNERRYQGLLRKQRLELNYLLKERERLLEAQKKLSAMAVQPVEKTKNEKRLSKQNKKRNKKEKKELNYPTLTKEQLDKQKFVKLSDKDDFISKVAKMNVDTPYAEYFSPTVDTAIQSEDKVLVTMPVKNPMAVSEIRRQRDLFEQKKKQKVLEKQQRKKKKQSHGNRDNQSDDRATYSVHSDIDEGVGFSMHSADVTTAATWGGSTEQSSSEDEDSAVGESYAATGDIQNAEDDDVYGSQFDQAEEEEEEADGASNIPPIFKKYESNRPRRGISWHQNDVTPGKKRKLDKKTDAKEGNGSVTWSLDVSPPRSRRKPKQRNLTPAHKLIQDQHKKRVSKLQEKELERHLHLQEPQNEMPSRNNNDQLSNQLASMCTSLLRNEQTLLSMLQTNNSYQPRIGMSRGDNAVLKNMDEYFATSNYREGFQETLKTLKTCYERIEHHQQDMDYLNRQFSSLQMSNPVSLSANEKSPWPNPPSLHISSLDSENRDGQFNTSVPQAFKPKKLSYPKETQTETTLFEDPFKPSIKPYTLFGKASQEQSLTISPSKKESNDFLFDPVLEPVSPGAVGDRSFTQPYDIPIDACGEDEEIRFPYRLRISEYNPLSYQGNFANTSTGNVITMSRMSMSKDHAETNVTNRPDRIWPSFFKLNGAISNEDMTSEKSLKENDNPTSLATSKGNKVGTSNQTAENTADGNFTLFEALRDSIYSEVATLIAMNESRPHYLIELFRELQLLNSDYLRQRALYALQELVTRFLTDENASPSKQAFKQERLVQNIDKQVRQWIDTESEQTPSESVMTTDDEGEAQALQSLARQIQNNEIYDYAEVVESRSDSSLSTPGSHMEQPFAAEDLGNTVINLDEALQKMRAYEQNMAEAKKAFEKISNDVHNSTPNQDYLQQRKKAAFDAIKTRMGQQAVDTMSSSSAGDVGSEASSDIPQPSIDTQKLDQQIKAVMTDLIPLLNERIDNVCTDSFLDEIRNLIFLCAKPNADTDGEKVQFGRFFFSQLDSILKDSLMKFSGRSLKECGGDLLIDVSEILFNEMAFYKLMQDLDRPLHNEAVGGADVAENDNQQKSKMPFLVNKKDNIESDLQSACQSMEHLNEAKKSNSNSSSSSSNAFVMIDGVGMETDEETESSRHFVKVELSQSESQPVRSSGSGEDDNVEEPLSQQQQQQVTLTSSMHLYSHPGASNEENSQDVVNENEAAEDDANLEDERDEGDQQLQIVLNNDENDDVMHHNVDDNDDDNQVDIENENAEDERNLDGVVEDENVEGQENIHRFEGDDDDRAEDELPEADMVSDANVEGVQLVLAHLDGQPELVGDSDVTPPH